MMKRTSFRKTAIVALLSGLTSVAGGSAMAGDGDMASIDGQTDGWAVMAGATLKGTLEGWSRMTDEQWNIIWDNPTDYRIRASATFYGSFEDSVGRLVDAIHQSNPELTVTLYRGNHVIHVDATSISHQ